ncbi:cysteine-rich receptor-like protein kinase, partial [Trifolium pratense]
EQFIWHPQVPLKVSVFAWRLLRDRLPTKSNIVPWIGTSSMVSTTIRDHFVQFTRSAGGSRARRSFLQLI